MTRGKVSLACTCAAATLAFPTAASAQIDPGINYDPGSPAGKEYAIPLVEGRSDGAGTTDQREGANIPFGVGIEPPSGAGGDRDGRQGSKGGAEGGNGAVDRGGGSSSEELMARIAAAEDPPSTAGRTLLLALALLLPAGVLALILWQRPQVSRTGRTA